MIYDEMEDRPNPEDERAEAWEYWHERAHKFETALHLISKMSGLTLIAPSLGSDGDRAHQIGAAAAFEQMASIAKDALSSPHGTKP